MGYGDLSPVTDGGRAVACLVDFCGTLLLALPVGVIGSHFLQLYRLEVEAPPDCVED